MDTTAKQVLNDAYQRMADIETEKDKETKVELKDEDVKLVVSVLKRRVIERLGQGRGGQAQSELS